MTTKGKSLLNKVALQFDVIVITPTMSYVLSYLWSPRIWFMPWFSSDNTAYPFSSFFYTVVHSDFQPAGCCVRVSRLSPDRLYSDGPGNDTGDRRQL